MRLILLLLISHALSGSTSWAQVEEPACQAVMSASSPRVFSRVMEERTHALYQNLLSRFGRLDLRRYAPSMISDSGQQALLLYAKILTAIESRAQELNAGQLSASSSCTKTLVRQALMRSPEALLEPWCENIATSLVKASTSPQLLDELEKLVAIALKVEVAEIVPFMNRIVDLTRGAFTADEVLEDRVKRLIVENKQINFNEQLVLPSLAYHLQTSFGQRLNLKWTNPAPDGELFTFYRAFPSGFIQTSRIASMASFIRNLRHADLAVADIPMPIVARFSRKNQGFVWSRIRIIKLKGGSLQALHGYELKLLQQAVVPFSASPKLQKQAFLAVARPVALSDFSAD